MKSCLLFLMIAISLFSLCGCHTNANQSDAGISTEVTQQSKHDETVAGPDISANPNTPHRDEMLNGRGVADIGRSEPEYVGVIGYASVSKGYEVENSTVTDWQWTVPLYEQDKQFWTETGSVRHKTEVIVKEQYLEHSHHGYYTGYLMVEIVDTEEIAYLNVKDFVTNPYWLNSDLSDAVRFGDFVAVFSQKSDYYPVNSRGEKLELDEGVYVLIDGITGSYGKNGPDDETNQVEGVVMTGERKGSRVHINENDLTIVY